MDKVKFHIPSQCHSGYMWLSISIKQNGTSSIKDCWSYFVSLNMGFIQLLAVNIHGDTLVRFLKAITNSANVRPLVGHHAIQFIQFWLKKDFKPIVYDCRKWSNFHLKSLFNKKKKWIIRVLRKEHWTHFKISSSSIFTVLMWNAIIEFLLFIKTVLSGHIRILHPMLSWYNSCLRGIMTKLELMEKVNISLLFKCSWLGAYKLKNQVLYIKRLY